MWLETLKELKKEKGLSSKRIAEMAKLPEKTVVRIFNGETKNPYADVLYRIAVALGVSLDDLLADSKAVVGSKSLADMQEEVTQLKAERDALIAENGALKTKVETLSDKVETLRDKVDFLKDEIISTHNYYIKQKTHE